MKLAVISDIHGNLPALEAVLADLDDWQPDWVVVDGDVVNRGPQPRECLHVILEKETKSGWPFVLGNHEEYVLVHTLPNAPRNGPEFEILRYSYWTYRQLGEDIQYIQNLPFCVTLEDGNHTLGFFTHASPLGTRDGIYPETTDEELRAKIPDSVSLLAVGHTHRPLVRTVESTLVVNAGAVGLPFDGDWRASYARLIWDGEQWRGHIQRVPYDRERTEQAFYTTGFLEEAGPLARLILVELQQARSLLYQWTVAYRERVLSGELSLEESVEAFLAEYVHSP